MTQPPLVIPATVEVPQAEKTTLANGATLYTLASDDFEVLRITFVFRAGSAVQRVPFSASAAANCSLEKACPPSASLHRTSASIR